MVGVKHWFERAKNALRRNELDELQSDDLPRVANLKREFAEHPSKGLTPARLYTIIEAAEHGDLKAQSELFEDMEEKDPQIGANLAKRRLLAAELEWQVVPPDSATAQEKKATDFCIEVLNGIEVEDLVQDMGSGLGHGWANLEIPWHREGKTHVIDQPILRPHSWFRLHPDDQNHITLRDGSPNGADLWPLGWMQHRHKAKPGYIARSGLMRMLVWPYLFQNYAIGDLAELLEIYGIPARVGTYPANASDKEKSALLRAVVGMANRAGGIVPEGMSIEFKEAAQGKNDMFETMINWCERSKAKIILGNILTSGTGEGTNTNALGNIHAREQQSLINSDIRQYSGTITRDLLWPLAALNFGVEDLRRAPKFFMDSGEVEDYEALARALPVFVNMGARISTRWLHERTRIPEATDDEEYLQPLTGRFDDGFGAYRAALKTASKPAVAADQIAQQMNVRGQATVGAWLQKVEDILEAADSLDEARAMLVAAFGELDSKELEGELGEALMAAHAAGRWELEQQSG